MLDTYLPTLAENSFTMRPYQSQAIERAIDHLFVKGELSGILQMATGTGKTPMAGTLIRECFNRGLIKKALVLAHREELIIQACNTLDSCGLAVGREQGRLKAEALYPPQVVVTTVQTMMRRLDDWPPDSFDLIIVDECHNYAAQRFSETIRHFNTAKLLGITATIDRADGKALTLFQQVIYSYSLFDAINDPQGPFLTPPQFIRINLGADLRSCRTMGKKGDYQDGDLARALQPHIELFANAITQEIGQKKTMVFMPDVSSSMAMASALKQLGVRSEWVSGDRRDRDEVVIGYKHGNYQAIVNCNLLGEGFDDKATECVVVRPTRSRVVYCQQVGRATRLYPGKEFARVIDFNHTTDMDLIGPSALVNVEPDVARAMNAIAAEENISLFEAVEQAKERARAERERIELSVRHLKLEYRRVEVSPFEMAKRMGVLQTSDTYGERATVKQVDLLKKWGWNEADGMTKRQATAIIQKVIERREAGLCTVKQLNLLVSLGVEPHKARQMSFESASDRIGQLLGQTG
jgi:superfamily II DNA or RNA helicase